jgi:ATP-dependent helicase/nuclease subunit B
MNRLTHALAAVCRESFLAEKWLLAPSLRVGRQWLDAVNRSGQPCVNVRVKTLKVMALELADPEKARQGTVLLSDRGAVLLLDRVCTLLANTNSGYLLKDQRSAGLSEAMHSSLTDLQLAGLNQSAIDPDAFEDLAKGTELRKVLDAYQAEARKHRQVGYPEILRMALERLRARSPLNPDVLVLVTQDLEPTLLERALLEALPVGQVRTLPVDEPGQPAEPAGSGPTDAQRLRWIVAPAEAPAPTHDGTAGLFRAVGEANEVREVLRRCLAAGYPLDEVEILYSDGATYVPLLYECLVRLQPEEHVLEEPPITFADGVPASYSRPGRALALWLAWMRADFPQQTLVQMIQEGLLQLPGREEAWGFDALAAMLKSVGIGFGKSRYLATLDGDIKAAEADAAPDADDKPDDGRKEVRQRRRAGLQVLRTLVANLLQGEPQGKAGQALLRAAVDFLNNRARAASELDHFARQKLIEEIEDLDYWLGLDDQPVSLNVWDWLESLPALSQVNAGNPEPGRIHAAPLLGGGHSGRRHTFLVGLDDVRFPGAGLQDPLLLDSERQKLSPALRTAEQRLRDKIDGFGRLLARLRGTVTLSFSCRDLQDDRDTFPSPVMLAAHRILSGKHDADMADLRADWPVAAFAPDAPQACLDESEWWAWRLCGPQPVCSAQALIEQRFPSLQSGREAAARRRSADFTIFDGRVEQAGRDRDPTAANGPVMTASRLETLGRCPLAYFFQYVMGIAGEDSAAHDRSVWLSPLAMGSLLHEVFEAFVAGLCRAGLQPDSTRDWSGLLDLLNQGVERYRLKYPVPGKAVFERQLRQLKQMARIFLMEEEQFWREHDSRPVYLETSIGGGEPGPDKPLDTADAVTMTLETVGVIRVRGRVDRIDRLGSKEPPTFAVWDYKTGSAYKYAKPDPFNQGRLVQSALYLALVQSRLQAVSPGAVLAYFGYLFLGHKSRGARLTWSPEEAAEGLPIVGKLVQIARSGAFLATDNADDCEYCGHRLICGDVAAITAASTTKLDNPANSLLRPFRELREYGEEA